MLTEVWTLNELKVIPWGKTLLLCTDACLQSPVVPGVAIIHLVGMTIDFMVVFCESYLASFVCQADSQEKKGVVVNDNCSLLIFSPTMFAAGALPHYPLLVMFCWIQ